MTTDTKGNVERLSKTLAAELGLIDAEEWVAMYGPDGLASAVAFLDYALLPFSNLEE